MSGSMSGAVGRGAELGYWPTYGSFIRMGKFGRVIDRYTKDCACTTLEPGSLAVGGLVRCKAVVSGLALCVRPGLV